MPTQESSEAPLLTTTAAGGKGKASEPQVHYEAPESPLITRQSHLQTDASTTRASTAVASRRARSVSTARKLTETAKHLQLQLETMSPIGGRVLFISWYAVLLIAFILQLVPWQWDCSNICGSDHCDLREFAGWSSEGCSRFENVTNSTTGGNESLVFDGMPSSIPLAGYLGQGLRAELVHREMGTAADDELLGTDANQLALGEPQDAELALLDSGEGTHDHGFEVVWFGGFSRVFSTELNRFVHFMLSLPRPEGVSGTVRYDILFKIVLRDLGPGGNEAQRKDYDKFEFLTTVVFFENREYSEVVTLPTSTTSVSNRSRVVLTASRLPRVLLNSTRRSSIAAAYQSKGYTITSIALRYVLIVASVAHMIRSIYHNVVASSELDAKRRADRPAAFEQWWVGLLQIGCILYLNPLFAAGVFVTPQPSFFAFLEFRLPLYFVTLVVCFMFALVSAANAWSTGANRAPPVWTQVINALLFCVVVTLDILDAANHDWDWGLEHCPNFECSTVGFVIYGLLIAFVVACTIWLRYIANNLGRKPYLSSRPQQLAMRLFIFIFSTYAVYYVVSSMVVVAIYQGFAAVVPYHGLLQLGVLLVSFTFVTILVFSFTYVLRKDGVPFHPSDPRWKRVRWPSKWFQWVGLHGGSGYIFFNEAEERRFYRIQTGEDVAERRRTATRVASGAAAAMPRESVYAASMRDSIAADSVRDDGAAATAAPDEHNDSDWSDVNYSDDDYDLSPGQRSPAQEGLTTGYATVEAAPALDPPARRESDPDEDDNANRGLLQNAARTALRIPARLLKRVEDGVVDAAVFFHVLSPSVKPFFCLETCVDALNLAWEAYGVNASAGDAAVQTGVTMADLLPKCCLCCIGNKEGGGVRGDEDSDASSLALSPTGTRARDATLSNVDYDTPQRSHATFGTGMEDRSGQGLLSPPSRAPSTMENAMPPINTEQYGYRNVAVYVGLDVQVVISTMDTEVERHRHKTGCIAVAFRGTENLSNAVQDVRIGHVEWEFMKQDTNLLSNATHVMQPRVHSGFLEVWCALRDRVLECVRDLRREMPNARLLITGHSLGGAIATFCAYELHRDCVSAEDPAPGLFSSSKGTSQMLQSQMLRPGPTSAGLTPPVVYTFGMPRVGNAKFRDLFDRKVRHFFRVVNESDAVSRLSVLGGAHVGMEVDIDRHGNYIIEPMFIERMFRPTKGRGSSIRHHSMSGYADSINNVTSHSGLGLCPSRALEPYVDAVMMIASAAYAPTPREHHGGTFGPSPSLAVPSLAAAASTAAFMPTADSRPATVAASPPPMPPLTDDASPEAVVVPVDSPEPDRRAPREESRL